MVENNDQTAQTAPPSGAQTAQTNGAHKTRETRESLRTKRLNEELPEGIQIGMRAGRASPYFVRYGPERKVKSFALEAERNDRAEELALALKEEGKEALSFAPGEIKEWLAFKRELGATFEQMRTLWRRYSYTLNTSTMTTEEAVKRYKALRLKEDVKEKTDTYLHMRKHLDALVAKFKDVQIGTITTEDLRNMLDAFADEDGPAFSKTTLRHYRMSWSTFFSRAIREKWMHADNPCEMVKPPKPDSHEKPLIPVKDAFHLLKANSAEPVAPKLALEMYGFMRCSSVGRMSKGEIDFEGRGIYMRGEHHKSGKGLRRADHYPVLWDWLALATEETWSMGERMYYDRKAEAFIRARVANPGNVLRRSCISYMLVDTGNYGQVGYLAQHNNIKITQGYESSATKADAALWRQLTPANVALTWEEFIAKAKTDGSKVAA